MSPVWIMPALIGAMFCALLGQYLALRVLIRLGVPRTREVEIGRVGDQPLIQRQRTPVSLAVDAMAYLGGLAGGWFVVFYLIHLVSGG
jgi:hypothetical protein